MAKSKTTIDSEIASELPDNSTRQISPLDLRTRLLDMVELPVTLVGNAVGDTHLGTFTGGIISASQTVKQALQALSNAFAPYLTTKNATTDWGTASGGLYSIALAAATHQRGSTPRVTVYRDIGGGSYQDATFEFNVKINASGDVTIQAEETPDSRAAIKIEVRR